MSHREEAENLAGPHGRTPMLHACVPDVCGPRECDRRERVQAIESALEQAEKKGEGHLDALQEKHNSCACAYEHPSDVCLWHERKMKQAEAEGFAKGWREAQLAAILVLDKADPGPVYKMGGALVLDAFVYAISLIRALLPPTEGEKP